MNKQSPIDKLLYGYFKACTAIGKPLNGLQKLKMRLELQTADANKVLEILEEIETVKRMSQYHTITIDANIPATQNPNPDIGDGTGYQKYGTDVNPWRYTTWWGSTTNGNSK